MHEVGELAGFVARQEEASAPYEEDLCRADACAVDLVVHDDRAGDVQRDIAAVLLETLCRAAICLPERAAERHLDPRGEVVEVLGLREVGHLARDGQPGRWRSWSRDLAQQEQPAF